MAQAKKNTRKKNTRKKNPMPNWTQSNLFRVCLLLCIIGISLISIFKWGLVGLFIYQLFTFLFGSFTIFFLAGIILACILYLFFPKHKKIAKRYIAAAIFLIIALSLFEAIEEFQPQPVWEGLKNIIQNTLSILMNQYNTRSGLLGAFLIGIFGTLFDYQGAFLLVILFVILAIVLVCYDWVLKYIKGHEKKPKKEKEIKKEPQEIPIHDSITESIFVDADPELKEDVEEKTSYIAVEKESEEIKKEPPEKEVDSRVAFTDDTYMNYRLPRLSLLEEVSRKGRSSINAQTAKQQGQKLMEILDEFGVKATLVQIHIGPSVTKFEVKPDLGVRVNKISNLQYDIKMALAAKDIRIEAPIPGKSAVGIEIPNREKTVVQMKDLMRSIPEKLSDKKLLFCLGKDLMGSNVYGELNRMPHLLIAGATGSGKSVCVNSIICSLLLRTKPNEVKLILIDPKKVEFTPYKDVPHLLAPVITDGDLANKALKVVVEMMDHRYDLFGNLGVRNIQAYNELVKEHPNESLKPMPRIVIIIDELADLMLVAAKEVESSIQRITQLARAAGIHLIVATQRPSVDVITGVIKANIPSRIAFAVSQAVDSRTILDQAGAERLLGYGDMLYLPNGETNAQRIQGVFIKDEEVNRISEYVKLQAKPRYDDAFIQLQDIANMGNKVQEDCADPLYNEVKHFVIAARKASTSLIQRKFSIGYSRAARLMDVLEDQKIIGPANGSKPREILVKAPVEDFEK